MAGDLIGTHQRIPDPQCVSLLAALQPQETLRPAGLELLGDPRDECGEMSLPIRQPSSEFRRNLQVRRSKARGFPGPLDSLRSK